MSDATAPVPTTNRPARVVAALTGRAGLRAIGALVLVLFVVLFPAQATRLVFSGAGVLLAILGVHGLAVSLRRPRRWSRAAFDALMVVSGVAIVWVDLVRPRALVVASAAILVAAGLVALVRLLVAGERRGDLWAWFSPIALMVVGALVFVVPGTLTVVAFTIAGVWMVSGVLNVRRALVDPSADPATLAETTTAVTDYLRTLDVGEETRSEVEQGLFFEGSTSLERTWRFVALMSFSTAIATFGITSDSTAVVIGAMLVAPLMTPILGMAASIVSGWSTRFLRSGGLVLVGIGIAIVLSFLLSRYVGGFLDVERNTQIASRVAPTLVDLAIAVAAGAAGAYANARRDVADSLPGVAIAVALVPPLSVVGTTLQAGELDMAIGAFLLFATNLVGIIVAAAVTFFLLGLTPWFRLEAEAKSIGRSFGTAVLALGLIAIPLALSGEDLLTSATTQASIDRVVDDFLADTDYQAISTNLRSGYVEVVVAGPPDSVIDTAGLATELGRVVDRPISVRLRVIPEEVFDFEVFPGG